MRMPRDRSHAAARTTDADDFLGHDGRSPERRSVVTGRKRPIPLKKSQSVRHAPVSESKAGTRKPRQVKVYKNPHTGEVVESKGGNHKILKEWKAEHGSATVESWLAK